MVLCGALIAGCSASGGREGGSGSDGGAPDLAMVVESPDMAISRVDPETCAEAEQIRSYLGCDFWPTPVANVVWNTFDFAAIVANPGTQNADVIVTGPSGFSTNAMVAPGSLTKIYLPWVPAL
jgi:hypothetical protein